MHIVQVRFAWRNDLRAGDASIKARFHHCASSDNSDPFETPSFDGPAHLGNHIDDGKRGYGLEVVDTEMSGNRCDADTFGRCRNKAVGESGIYGGCATASFLARLLRSVGESACTMVSSSVAFFLANVEINRR